jgi:hypothetical protein
MWHVPPRIPPLVTDSTQSNAAILLVCALYQKRNDSIHISTIADTLEKLLISGTSELSNDSKNLFLSLSLSVYFFMCQGCSPCPNGPRGPQPTTPTKPMLMNCGITPESPSRTIAATRTWVILLLGIYLATLLACHVFPMTRYKNVRPSRMRYRHWCRWLWH